MEIDKDNKFLLFNSNNKDESLYFVYPTELEELTESKGSLTFVMNNKKISKYDATKFSNLINIVDGNMGIYAKKRI